MKIEIPDGTIVETKSTDEAIAFVIGYRAALRCYGIWHDGVQQIGCTNTPIKDALNELKIDGKAGLEALFGL